MDNPMAILNDGSNTHVNRATGGMSALDVSLVHNSLVAGASWKRLTHSFNWDHYPIEIELVVSPVTLVEHESKLRWDWRNADWEGFSQAVDQSVGEAQPGLGQLEMKERIKVLSDGIQSAARTHVGMIRIKKDGRCWVTPELKAAVRRRNWLGRRIADHREAWVEACREVRRQTISAKQESWRTFVESLEGQAGTSRVWGVIRSLNGKRPRTDAGNSMLEHGASGEGYPHPC